MLCLSGLQASMFELFPRLLPVMSKYAKCRAAFGVCLFPSQMQVWLSHIRSSLKFVSIIDHLCLHLNFMRACPAPHVRSWFFKLTCVCALLLAILCQLLVLYAGCFAWSRGLKRLGAVRCCLAELVRNFSRNMLVTMGLFRAGS